MHNQDKMLAYLEKNTLIACKLIKIEISESNRFLHHHNWYIMHKVMIVLCCVLIRECEKATIRATL